MKETRLCVAHLVLLVWATQGIQVPGGHGDLPASCITALANGATFNVAESGYSIGCRNYTATVSLPQVQIYAADVHLKSETPLKSFTADWVVPPLPTDGPRFGRSQVVYFWPGFKALRPEMGYPVLQPVLQYGERGRSWELQSWFVDAKDRRYPVVTAPPVSVEPGHTITSSISQSSDGQIWTVSGTDKDTGEDSTLHVAYAKSGDVDYEYAMLVNENVNVDTHCTYMPATANVTFFNVTVNGRPSPPWELRANCAGNPSCDCGNSATVLPTGDVVLGWQTHHHLLTYRRDRATYDVVL